MMSTLLITVSVILFLGLLTAWKALTIIARVWEMSEGDDRPWPENTATQLEAEPRNSHRPTISRNVLASS